MSDGVGEVWRLAFRASAKPVAYRTALGVSGSWVMASASVKLSSQVNIELSLSPSFGEILAMLLPSSIAFSISKCKANAFASMFLVCMRGGLRSIKEWIATRCSAFFRYRVHV